VHITLVFALFSILLFGAPVYAQNPCVDCLKAAQGHLKQSPTEEVTDLCEGNMGFAPPIRICLGNIRVVAFCSVT